MFADLLRGLLAPSSTQLPDPDARLALAALLVRLARTDRFYSAEEIERIDRILMQRHGLSAEAAAALRKQAETLEEQAPDTVRFTKAIKAVVPLDERTRLLEAFWSVALADGQRSADEDQMLRLIANLLGVSDVDSGLARQKAERG